jgi:nucleoid-associated protein YgaU
VRLIRSSLRIRVKKQAVWAACATLTLGFGAACGAGTAAAPTPTSVPSASVAPAVAPSPPRPALASPVASPSAAPAAVSPTSTTEPVAAETYEVQSGDTLLTIAQEKYGDGAQWRRIYDANKDVIGSDPDKLKIGMQLKIPPKQP